MKYILQVEYTSKPNWIVNLVAVAKGYLNGSENFTEATSIIENCLDEQQIITRSARSCGVDIRREVCYDNLTLTIYNQTKNILCVIKYIQK